MCSPKYMLYWKLPIFFFNSGGEMKVLVPIQITVKFYWIPVKILKISLPILAHCLFPIKCLPYFPQSKG